MKCKLLRQAIAMSKYAITGLLMQMIFYTLLMASDGVAQLRVSMEDIYLTLELEEATLEETFRVISEKTDFKFAFDLGRVHLKDKVTTRAKNESLSSIFRDISQQANLRFRRVNDNIFVTWKNGGEIIEADIILDESLQGITVTGRVTSLEDNEGLPGVNVIIKGTSHGTVTDVMGQYQIDVPTTESILVFSSVGFIHEEISVGNRAVIDITLAPDIQALEEIVVVGYGAVRKSDLTGSVSQVKSEEISAYPTSNVAQALQGRAAGFRYNPTMGNRGLHLKFVSGGQHLSTPPPTRCMLLMGSPERACLHRKILNPLKF
jgi:hypothetical protein